ncbi:hypothetical protein RJ639_047446 [Escallonia herrerae]|uniref:Uncharacterized protein n=1 Tax=Escallonia herrerae TaxID=1293975 RepID=A0AA89B2H6_9ASTE|nr:hypothetical protein RJ639_047446 [Escallonia herrerae]
MAVDVGGASVRCKEISDEGRCAAITNCLIRKASLPHLTANNIASSSKVTPQPTMPLSGVTGAPRLVRSHAVSRDLVRDWNFDEVVMERLSREDAELVKGAAVSDGAVAGARTERSLTAAERLEDNKVPIEELPFTDEQSTST